MIVYYTFLNVFFFTLVLKVETPDLMVNPNDIIFPLVSEYTTYNENESFAQIRIPHEHLTERYNSTSVLGYMIYYNYMYMLEYS